MSMMARQIEETIEQLRGSGAHPGTGEETGAESSTHPWMPAGIAVTEADLPALVRALEAAREGKRAWIGFKTVTDGELCLKGTGCEPHPGGSANADSFLFFADEDREIVCGHAYSERDRFQMLDVTRGPAMHTDQYGGLEWHALPLFPATRLVIFGASEVARFTAAYAADADFAVEAVDDDLAFLSAERFPHAKRILSGFGNLDGIPLGEDDFVCVLTRNHAHDPEALMRALQSPAAYIGLIGHVDKIAGNYTLLRHAGVDPDAFERVHAPIGVKCGAKTAPEIAISIVAELIAERRALRG